MKNSSKFVSNLQYLYFWLDPNLMCVFMIFQEKPDWFGATHTEKRQEAGKGRAQVYTIGYVSWMQEEKGWIG